jgi:hypothetical protein
MVDLVQWLTAQLDEDERIARACSGMEWWEHPKNWVSAPPLNRIAVVVHDGDRGHIVRHDPARVLREIDAKRRIIAEHALNGWVCSTCDDGAVPPQAFPCPTLRLLALPYADRSDYREEWAP